MKWFKTRKEVQALRREVQDLREMLVVHFDIKYTMQDYSTWHVRHPNAPTIPVTDGEWWHYGSIIGDPNTAMPSVLMYRGKDLEITPTHPQQAKEGE